MKEGSGVNGYNDARPAAQKGKGEASKASPTTKGDSSGPSIFGSQDARPSAGSGKAKV